MIQAIRVYPIRPVEYHDTSSEQLATLAVLTTLLAEADRNDGKWWRTTLLRESRMGQSVVSSSSLLLCLAARSALAAVVGVQLVGERVFPTGFETLDDPAATGTPAQLGGLAALTYDQSLERWFATDQM